jgi:hypothetical protein
LLLQLALLILLDRLHFLLNNYQVVRNVRLGTFIHHRWISAHVKLICKSLRFVWFIFFLFLLDICEAINLKSHKFFFKIPYQHFCHIFYSMVFAVIKFRILAFSCHYHCSMLLLIQIERVFNEYISTQIFW